MTITHLNYANDSNEREKVEPVKRWNQMTNDLKEIIKRLRNYLTSIPDSILLGQINEGNSDSQVEDPRGGISEYLEFLKECDGASFGEIILFSSCEAGKNQFYVETLQGRQEDWLFSFLAIVHG
jgi:hypothetical protein